MKNINKRKKVFVVFLIVAFSMWCGIIFFGSSKYVDEKTHARQINRFTENNYDILPNLTTLPGYHLMMSIPARIFEKNSTRQLRIISLIFASLSIAIFYLIAKKLDAKYPLEKTLQFVFFPITFFYFPLVYTDIFSLLIVLIAFLFLISRSFYLSALFSLASIFVRQSNVVWVVFFLIYAYVKENDFQFSFSKAWQFFKKVWIFVFVFAVFFVFLVINGGVAVGDQGRHLMGFYLGNIYFFLALVGLVFLPALFRRLLKIREINQKKVYFALAIGSAIAIAFVFFPPALHEYNFKMNFLRNIVLQAVYNKFILLYAGAVFLGIVVLFIVEFKREILVLLPFSFFCLSQSFLIEQRYAIIPFVFMLLFKKEENLKMEYVSIVYFFILSSGLMFVLLRFGIFF